MESYPHAYDLQHPQFGKPPCGLQIMDTRTGFPCPFQSVVIDAFNPILWGTNFRGFVEGLIHKFQYRPISDFLYEL